MTTKNTKRFVYLWGAVIILFLGFYSSMTKAQSNDAAACRLIQDNIKRLACFDMLSVEQTSNDKPQIVDPTPVTATTETNREIDDIDKRAQALMTKSKKYDEPFSGNKPRISATTNRPAVNADDSFGSEFLRNDEQDQINKIQTRIISVSKDAKGYATITLSNEQIWRQTETSRFSIKENDLISIEKGVFGAYYLSKSDNNRQLRVQRIE
jgi:hypothetical protein